MKKYIPAIISIFLFSEIVFAQSNSKEWLMYNIQNGDTTLFCNISKAGKYYSFNFKRALFFSIKKDSSSNRIDTIEETTNYSYGPYAFYKRTEGIMYTVKGIDSIKRLMFSFSDIKKSSGWLFSTAYNSSFVYTWLVNKNAEIYQNGKAISCYLLKSENIQSPNSYFSMLYIDKKYFLPIKIEFCRLENTRQKLINEICILNF